MASINAVRIIGPFMPMSQIQLRDLGIAGRHISVDSRSTDMPKIKTTPTSSRANPVRSYAWTPEAQLWSNLSPTKGGKQVGTSLYLSTGPVERFSLDTDNFTLARTAPDGANACALRHVQTPTKHIGDVNIVLPTSPWIAQTAAQHFGASIDKTTEYSRGPESKKGKNLVDSASEIATAFTALKGKIPDLYSRVSGAQPTFIQRTLSLWPDRSRPLTLVLVASRLAKSSSSGQGDAQSSSVTKKEIGAAMPGEYCTEAALDELSDRGSVHTVEADVEFWHS